MAGSVGKKAAAMVASDADKKRLAEKSFTSYVRAVQLMPNKQVRDSFCWFIGIPVGVHVCSCYAHLSPEIQALRRFLGDSANNVQ